jgi:phage terminase large subunit-like protein
LEGQVFLPERADWLPDLEAELFAFPGARHDDQCDSISQAPARLSRPCSGATSNRRNSVWGNSKVP